MSPSPSTSDSTGPVTAEQALAAGGLTLPANSSGETAERMDVSEMQWLEGFRVTFKAPRSNALQICRDGGLTGDLPSRRFSPQEQELLGSAVVHTEGTRVCSGLWPDAMAWQRTVAVAPGDPTTVYVAIARMGR